MQSRYLCNLASAPLRTAGPEAAQLVFEQAVTIATTHGDRVSLAFSQIGLANAALLQNDLQRAASTANQARMSARRLGPASLSAEAAALMMHVAILQQDLSAAPHLLLEISAETEGKI